MLEGQHIQFTGSFFRDGGRWLRDDRVQLAELHGARVAADGSRGRYLTVLVLGDLAQVQVTDPVHHRSKHGVWVAKERELGNHVCLTNQDGFEDLLAGLPTPCLQALLGGGDIVELMLPVRGTQPIATASPELAVRRARQIPVHEAVERSTDLAGLDRGAAAHEATLRLLEAHLDPIVALQISTVPVDVAWVIPRTPTILNIAEVKSLTGTNQAHQIRLAIGQLIEYRATLIAALPKDLTGIHAFLALEREPDASQRWQVITDSVGITLTWAPGFPDVG
jgi:hypothetical protein